MMEKVTKSTDLPCASKNDMETLLVLKVLQRSLTLVLNASGLSPPELSSAEVWVTLVALLRDSGTRKGQTDRGCKAILTSGVSQELESSCLF